MGDQGENGLVPIKGLPCILFLQTLSWELSPTLPLTESSKSSFLTIWVEFYALTFTKRQTPCELTLTE